MAFLSFPTAGSSCSLLLLAMPKTPPPWFARSSPLACQASCTRTPTILTVSDCSPGATRLRDFLKGAQFAGLTPKLEYSMLGRTYALGHEPDLDDWLFEKPKRTVTNRESPWAVWYPLRRSGAFSALPPEEQTPILREHGKIGHSFGDAGYAQDVRLACFGLDKNDNDFVIGLIGAELYPLSACVQAMRKTKQTSQYIQQMGPFFVGKAIWQGQ